MIFRLDRTESVHRPADHVHNPSQAFLADRHHDRRSDILGLHAPDQTIGNVHGDAPDDIVPQVLGHLDDEVVRLIIDRRVGDGDRVQDIGKLTLLKRHVNDRSDDLYYRAYIHTRLLQSIMLCVFC